MSASLQDQLDAITARTRALVQPDRLAISEQAAADLFATGIEDHILPVGSEAPSFQLQDARTNQPVSSTDLFALGPVILKFFRGRWDPYCVTELETWREFYPHLRERNTLFIAISPQNRRQNDFTAQQHALTFPILSDPGCLLADQFRIAHTVPPAARSYFRSILVNIPYANAGLTYDTASEASWRLPLPALYLIQPTQNGAPTITFAEAHADNRVRPEPQDLLSLL